VDDVLDAEAVPTEVDEAVRVLSEKVGEIHTFASPPDLSRGLAAGTVANVPRLALVLGAARVEQNRGVGPRRSRRS
jgi:hypothetical protein